jgi:hypothetical protein
MRNYEDYFCVEDKNMQQGKEETVSFSLQIFEFRSKTLQKFNFYRLA